MSLFLLRNLKFLNSIRQTTFIGLTSAARTKASSSSASEQRASTTGKRDDPVKFSTSEAKKWDAMDTFVPEKGRRVPPSQPIIIVLSVTVFLIYFLLLREENELDRKLLRPLEESVPNIKEFTLRKQIQQYENMGLDSSELKQALSVEIKNRRAAESSSKK